MVTQPSDPPNPTLPAPPPVPAALARSHRAYWRFNVALIGVLLVIGFAVSFGVPLFAQRLQHVRIAGFPLPFYFGAQGAILVYMTLIVAYILLMQIADARLLRAVGRVNVAEDAQDGAAR